MSFSSLHFLFVFLPSFLVIYFIVPAAGRNAFLFAASMVFYMFGAWSRPQYIALLLFSVVVNFWIGKAIEKTLLPRLLLSAGIACNLAWLCLFKYSNLLMPLGISFYTFRSISYLVDVYRKEVPAAHAFVDFGAYLTFFPQVISGPIEKYREMREELKTRPASFENIDQGLKQFTIGLGFKMLIADRIGSCWNDIAAIGFESISAPVAWMGIFAYSFELYFDFYGYSLMAAGIAKMIGFETPDNFTHPYESVSMTDFWRRWHMTLGSWFREYVYIPLGGNRRSMPRVYFNLFVVWILTGIWHGAGLNFILWGLFLFVVIALEKAGLKRIMERRRIVGHLYMLFLIPLSWMIFAIDDVNQIGLYLTRLFDFAGNGSETVFAGDFAKFAELYGVLLLVCAVFSTSLPERLIARIKDNLLGTVVLFVIFWASVYLIYLGLSDPFMYFRF